MKEASPSELIATLEVRQDALLAQLRELNDRIEAALVRLSESASPRTVDTDPPESASPIAPPHQTPTGIEIEV